jgi:hypothetical protein
VAELIVSAAAPVLVTLKTTAADLVKAGLDESLTVVVMGKLPPLVGLPEMMPVPAANVSPAGSLPEEIDQV